MTIGTRRPGEFCWINMLTPDPPAARAFFGAVLDWSYVEMPGMGHRVQVGGRDIGGLFDVVSPRTPQGMPPVIGVMVKVENADATGDRVRFLGGKAESAFDIGEAGRMAVCHDPDGAQFDLWEPGRMAGTEVDSTLHGAPSWYETITTDVPRATEFYSRLFGWTPEVQQIPSSTYTSFRHHGEYVAGMMGITPEMGNMQPHWGTYFTVRDSDEAVRNATELGGTICVPARDIAGVGRFAGIVSPQGVVFYVISDAH
jgi:predicted enzyme related to lactoylglutathione lyase